MSNALIKRVSATACAFAVGASISGVLPGFAILLGHLDSDHEITVSASRAEIELRFHHHSKAGPDHASAAAYPALESIPAESHDDHVVRFASATYPVFASQTEISRAHLVAALFSETIQLAPIARTDITAYHARPPPDERLFSRCHSSVVLLV